ncbi:unnamed protein product [Durusdinium trenchii]|uniref:Uncharacterized protein n=1 Tax=Durusdinium trenchii TaxID=1381693 RepID=A0ABP0HCR3_9DINO
MLSGHSSSSFVAVIVWSWSGEVPQDGGSNKAGPQARSDEGTEEGSNDKAFRTQQEADDEKAKDKIQKARAEAAAFEEEQRQWLLEMKEQEALDGRHLSKTRRTSKDSKGAGEIRDSKEAKDSQSASNGGKQEEDELSPQERRRKAKEEQAENERLRLREAAALMAQEKQKAHERRMMDQRGTFKVVGSDINGLSKTRVEDDEAANSRTASQASSSRTTSKDKKCDSLEPASSGNGLFRGAGSAIAGSASTPLMGLRPGSGGSSSEKGSVLSNSPAVPPAEEGAIRVSPASGRTKGLSGGDASRGPSMSDVVRVREQTLWVKPP